MLGQARALNADDSLQKPAVLMGTVSDSTGAAIANVSIELKVTNSPISGHTTTDATGHYRLTAPAGAGYREKVLFFRVQDRGY